MLILYWYKSAMEIAIYATNHSLIYQYEILVKEFIKKIIFFSRIKVVYLYEKNCINERI